ncbi:MAG: glycosyltransferase [Candidatus Lokiarchaeota archaeon]|nr:glycosyltransferase [Candidatus Lokiarchaeota archaeon]
MKVERLVFVIREKLRIFVIGKNEPEQNSVLLKEAFERLGHEVFIYSFPEISHETLINNIHYGSPDILLQFGGRGKRINHLAYAKRNGVVTALWYADAYGLTTKVDHDFFYSIKDHLDIAFISVKGLVSEISSLGINAVWVPQYYDNHFYAPTVERLQSGNDIYDWVFVGNRNNPKLERESKLKKILRSLRKSKFKICGKGYSFKADYVTGTELANLFSCSKMVINFTYKLNPCDLQMSDRIFKVMGCGAMFLTEPIMGIEKLFTPGKHLVQFNSLDDLVEKITYYKSETNAHRREEIALNGKQEVLNNHTIDIRAKEYIKHFFNILSVSGRMKKDLRIITKKFTS